jgi:predicted nucleic acid binding AN1-type Zn finger protein
MEFYDLGKHCKECNTQDYLPIICDQCKFYFCKDHYSIGKHKCISKENEQNKITKKNPDRNIKFKCSLKNCKKKDYFEIKCFDCGKHHCLKHRYKEIHNCQENKNMQTIYEGEELTFNKKDDRCCIII